MGKFVFIRLVCIFIGRVRVIKKTLIQHIFFITELTRPLYFTSRLIENENDILFPLAAIALAFGSTAAGCTPLYEPYRELRPKRAWFFSRFGQK